MLDKYFYKLIAKKSRNAISDNSSYLLNETEIRYIKKKEFQVIFLSAFYRCDYGFGIVYSSILFSFFFFKPFVSCTDN